jgi:hypothetical protein
MDPTMASCHFADGFTVVPRPALAAISARYAAAAVHTASHDAGPLAYPRHALTGTLTVRRPR